jgi:hypothetical protein
VLVPGVPGYVELIILAPPDENNSHLVDSEDSQVASVWLPGTTSHGGGEWCLDGRVRLSMWLMTGRQDLGIMNRCFCCQVLPILKETNESR